MNRYRLSRDGRKRCQTPTGTITKGSKGGHRDPSTSRACLDLDWLDSSRILRRHQHAIRRRQQRHSAYPWRLAGLWASDTDWNYGPGGLVRLRVLARLVAFLGFPLIQTDSDCSRSLAHQDRLCCPNRSRVSPTLLIGAGTTNSGSSHAPPCQTLCSPPVGLFSSNPTQPPTLA